MGDLVLKGGTSGQITLTPTAIAGTNTLTLPAKTGNLITSADSGTVTQTMLASNVVGNGPAFSVYLTGTQNVSTGTFTKIQFNNKTFDTNTNFDATTNYRFTPNVAGYYQINASMAFSSMTGSAEINIYKNGSLYLYGPFPNTVSSASPYTAVSSVVYCNGSTDFIEIWAWQGSGGTVALGTGSTVTQFNGALVRSA